MQLEPLEPSAPDALKGRSILLGAAEADARTLFLEALRRAGAAVFAVDGPSETFSSAAGRTFDAIIVAGTSRADVLTAARRLRALPQTGGGPALIGIFPSLSRDTHDEAEEAGLDAYLPQTAHPAALTALVALLLRPGLAQGSVQTAELDEIQRENQSDEHGNGDERGHQAPPEIKVSGAL